ncbi:nectin-3-like [Lissotriton helveticus]
MKTISSSESYSRVSFAKNIRQCSHAETSSCWEQCSTRELAMKVKAARLFLAHAICSFIAGFAMVIHEKTLTATEGSRVTLQCQLKHAHDVLQVTWQKDPGDFSGTMATYSKAYGRKLMGHYKSRVVDFSRTELNSTAITLHSVSLGDEGCYKCIFNVFPTGAIIGRTCLHVYAISEPRLEASFLSKPESLEKEIILSCSATGKPAPEITWNLTQSLRGKPQHYFIDNPNRTITVISNFTYVSSRFSPENLVTCVLRHPALNVEITLPVETEMQNIASSSPLVLVVSPIIIMLAVSVLWFSSG